MGSGKHTRKAWVRKHQPSIWEETFGKKKRDKKKDDDRNSMRAQHGSPPGGFHPAMQEPPNFGGPVYSEQGGSPGELPPGQGLPGPDGHGGFQSPSQGLGSPNAGAQEDLQMPFGGRTPFPRGAPGMEDFGPHNAQVRGGSGGAYLSPPPGLPRLGEPARSSSKFCEDGGSGSRSRYPGMNQSAPGSPYRGGSGQKLQPQPPVGRTGLNEQMRDSSRFYPPGHPALSGPRQGSGDTRDSSRFPGVRDPLRDSSRFRPSGQPALNESIQPYCGMRESSRFPG
ncbi:hypothetical protein FB567DRAFT_611180 [Paraphoma chrysanthemicola]|uniref:Uncharacterized protein n=1 Tax=Paraphoma chrysanthemicola TaxID=798071 RepID=A0A8K0QVY8_9PLEO|nr:hypothetical protein FB567DRAFT_611180 [Paraphoma chrysanthemicola]